MWVMRERWQAIYKMWHTRLLLFSTVTQGSWNKCNYHKKIDCICKKKKKDTGLVNKVWSKYKMIMCNIQRGSGNSLEFMDVCAVGDLKNKPRGCGQRCLTAGDQKRIHFGWGSMSLLECFSNMVKIVFFVFQSW